MPTYQELAASRRTWIDDVLIDWCHRANRAELMKAEGDWVNIAGQVDPEKTLWTWAWSRFPALVPPDLDGLDEAREVLVQLADGRAFTGYADSRNSRRGELHLLCTNGEEVGPLSIDDVADVSAAGG